MKKLNIGAVLLPRKSLLAPELDLLIQWCRGQGANRYKDREASIKKRQSACQYLLEGLYQAWCCVSPNTALEIPIHVSSYHSKAIGAINHLSHQFVVLALKGLEDLGWVSTLVGYRRSDGSNVITKLLPAGHLLSCFEAIGVCWQELQPPKIGIVLRGAITKDDAKVSTRVPDTMAVRRMQANLNRINRFLAKQAICLHLSNERITALGAKDSRVEFALIFTHTALRRIFSRGSMEMGGRFYGGWWEGLPSEYRPFISINGHATGEVDFSELHPRLLYLLNGQTVPCGDLYDDGWRDASAPLYDKTIEPYRSRRKLFKQVFNATLNDELGTFRLPKDDAALAKSLGLSLSSIRKLLFQKHPLLKEHARSGIGLRLQYIDSQIAEQVMLDLLEQHIPCLPVHDSFLVPRHQGRELILSMRRAFKAVTGHDAKLKDMEPFGSDFRLPFLPNGEIDRDALYAMFENSIHERFVRSREG